MSWSLIVLLLAAAALHAVWNLLVKRAERRHLLLWGALAVSSVCFLPLLAVRPSIAGAWPLVVASAAVEAVYFALLLAAYRIGDFSVVYPVARGTAPALLAVWSVLFLRERPRLGGIVGLVLIVIGLLAVGGTPRKERLRGGGRRAPGSGLALLIALLISVYSVIDGAAVKRVDPTAYTVIMFGLSTVMFTPLVARQYGWTAIADGLRAQPGLIVGVGVLQCLAYMLVLYVYSRAPVSYAGAIREVSIVLGAVAGWLFLGEPFGARRVVGALIMFAGIACIALAG